MAHESDKSINIGGTADVNQILPNTSISGITDVNKTLPASLLDKDCEAMDVEHEPHIIVVSDLHPDADESMVQNHFRMCHGLKRVILTPGDDGMGSTAYICFDDSSNAETALHKRDKLCLGGTDLLVSIRHATKEEEDKVGDLIRDTMLQDNDFLVTRWSTANESGEDEEDKEVEEHEDVEEDEEVQEDEEDEDIEEDEDDEDDDYPLDSLDFHTIKK